MNSFSKNVAVMAMAPVTTQLLSILITPVITRLYTPDDFGLLAVFGSIIGPLGVISTFGYSPAIVMPKKDKTANSLFWACIIFSIFTASASFSVYLLKDSTIFTSLNLLKLDGYLWLIPLGLFLNGTFMALRYWNIRYKRFALVSLANIFRFVANNGIVLIVGIAGKATGLILIFGGIMGSIVSPYILSKSIWKERKIHFTEQVKIYDIKYAIKRYSKFPKFVVANDFISRLSSQVPIYFLVFYFTQSAVGYYALGLRLLTIPINLIGNAIGEVLFQDLSLNRDNISNKLEKTFDNLLRIGIPIFCYLGFVGGDVFTFIFGEEWTGAGEYAQILSLLLFVRFITLPSSYLTLIYEKQELTTILNITILVSSCIAMTIGGIYDSINIALLLYSTSNSIIYLLFGILFMKMGGVKALMVMRYIINNILIAIPYVISLIAIKLFFVDSKILITICSSIVLIMFYIYWVVSSPEMKMYLGLAINKLKNKLN